MVEIVEIGCDECEAIIEMVEHGVVIALNVEAA